MKLPRIKSDRIRNATVQATLAFVLSLISHSLIGTPDTKTACLFYAVVFGIITARFGRFR
jgi:hypothetical protein